MDSFQALFDTKVDTKKIFVSIKHHFYIRNYQNKQGKSPVYIYISSPGGCRARPKTEIEIIPEYWDPINHRQLDGSPDAELNNVLLGLIGAKISKIKASYLLVERPLTATKLAHELLENTPRFDFNVYFKHRLEFEKKNASVGYYKRLNKVHLKVKRFSNNIPFIDMNLKWFENYRIYCLDKGNEKSTIAGNIAVIKKILKQAIKDGIKIPVDLDDIKRGSMKGNRIDLSPVEVRKFVNYYYSEFINPEWKLILGYFLFSCFTSIRWSQVMDLSRNEILQSDFINFFVSKNDKRQSITINKTARGIVIETPELFVRKISDQQMNKEIKKIARLLGVTRKLSFHVARHTFATNFIRMGGNVVTLQSIMGHSKIDTTMIYVHIVSQEASKEMSLMDHLI